MSDSIKININLNLSKEILPIVIVLLARIARLEIKQEHPEASGEDLERLVEDRARAIAKKIDDEIRAGSA